MKNLISALIVGLAVFAAVLLGNSLKKPEVITVQSSNPVVDQVDTTNSLGSFNTKYITATSSKVTVTATPTSLKSLMQTADSTLSDSAFNQINQVVIQPTTGAIRYLVGTSAYPLSAGMVAGTNGAIIYQSNKEQIMARPDEIYLVRNSAESSNVTLQIVSTGTTY